MLGCGIVSLSLIWVWRLKTFNPNEKGLNGCEFKLLREAARSSTPPCNCERPDVVSRYSSDPSSLSYNATSVSSENDQGMVLWVLMVHFTGKVDRYKTLTNTWFKRTHPRMGIVAFTEEKNRKLFHSVAFPVVFYPAGESMTDHTLRTMRVVLPMYPNAVYITKADDDAYIFTKRLALTLFANIPYNYQGENCGPQLEVLKLGADFAYACGGASYTMTRYAAEKLAGLVNPIDHFYEDIGVGLKMKLALGAAEFSVHPILVHGQNVYFHDFRADARPPLTFHYMTPQMMDTVHDEFSNWRRSIPRAPIPRIFHHLDSVAISSSCTELNPSWVVMTWTEEKIKTILNKQSQNSQNKDFYDSGTLVQYAALYSFGGIFLDASDKCTQSLDVPLSTFAQDFDKDGYYLAYDFREHGYRAGLFVMRPLSFASSTLYRGAVSNVGKHPLDFMAEFQVDIAILPATGLFARTQN